MMLDREGRHENTTTFAVSQGAKPVEYHRDRPTCKHCGKVGHEETSCLETVGYRPAWSTVVELDEEVAEAVDAVA